MKTAGICTHKKAQDLNDSTTNQYETLLTQQTYQSFKTQSKFSMLKQSTVF